MSYSDAEMVIASQIAYYDFDPDMVDSHAYTIREILDYDCLHGDAERKKKAQELLQKIDNPKTHTTGCGDWIPKSLRDNNEDSGMYAVMLETGDRQAMIAYRGSEDPSDPNQLRKDWIESDFGLLNSTLTPQQEDATRYMESLYAKYGDEYDSFGVTGHSLGGNLAQSAAVTAPDAMKDKITQCVSLDGPGFSNEYIAEHYNDIMKLDGKMTHLQWSVVGSLLFCLPATNNRIVYANTPSKKRGDTEETEWNPLSCLLNRHDTVNLEYDENGQTKDSMLDPLAYDLGPLSRKIDYFISFDLLAQIKYPGIVILDTFDKIKDWIEQRIEEYRQGIARREAARHCSFEFDPLRTAEAISALESCANQLGNIWQRIEEIRSTVNYLRIPVRYQLGLHIRSLKKQQQYTEKLARCGENCATRYRKTEASLAG